MSKREKSNTQGAIQDATQDTTQYAAEDAIQYAAQDATLDSETQAYEAFQASIDTDLSEDEVKLAMIQAGATFKNVTRLYNQFMIDAGLAMSKEDKTSIIENTLEGRDLSTEEGFEEASSLLSEAIVGSTERSSDALVRAYAKKNEVECYAKPKSSGSGESRNPFVTNFHAALIENPNMDEAGLKAIIAALTPDQQTNPLRWFSQHNNIRKTVNAVAAKFA